MRERIKNMEYSAAEVNYYLAYLTTYLLHVPM